MVQNQVTISASMVSRGLPPSQVLAEGQKSADVKHDFTILPPSERAQRPRGVSSSPVPARDYGRWFLSFLSRLWRTLLLCRTDSDSQFAGGCFHLMIESAHPPVGDGRGHDTSRLAPGPQTLGEFL